MHLIGGLQGYHIYPYKILGNFQGLTHRRHPGSLTLSSLSLGLEDKLKVGQHMSFSTQMNSRRTLALLDNGSEGDLIDYSHARRLQLPILKLNNPIPLYLANGKLYKVLTEAT